MLVNKNILKQQRRQEGIFSSYSSPKEGQQITIQRPFSCQGVGVHTGKKATLQAFPAEANSGITFVRTDLSSSHAKVKASWENVVDTRLCTRLESPTKVSVSTVEHLLAALAGFGVDNLLIKLNGPEVPIMDGSSSTFVRLLAEAGLKVLEAPKKILKVTQEIKVGDQVRWATLSPSDESLFSFKCTFDRPTPFQDQNFHFVLTPANFWAQIAPARTFGFVEEVEALQAKGFALGASLENAIGITASAVMNPEGLRFQDECVRHKILDAIGDLSLAGMRILGHYQGKGAGHTLNYQLLRQLMLTPDAYEIVELEEEFLSHSVVIPS